MSESIFRELLRTYTAAQVEITVGTKRAIDGKTYRFIQVSASSENACAANKVMLNTGSWVVSDDITANQRNDVIGIGIGAIAKSSFGWIQTYGEGTVATNGDDDISDGDCIIPADSTGNTYDGTCDSVAAGSSPTYKIIGWATADDSNTDDTVATFITLDG